MHIGVWRSPVARSAGGREAAGSNPVTPTEARPLGAVPFSMKEDHMLLKRLFPMMLAAFLAISSVHCVYAEGPDGSVGGDAAVTASEEGTEEEPRDLTSSEGEAPETGTGTESGAGNAEDPADPENMESGTELPDGGNGQQDSTEPAWDDTASSETGNTDADTGSETGQPDAFEEEDGPKISEDEIAGQESGEIESGANQEEPEETEEGSKEEPAEEETEEESEEEEDDLLEEEEDAELKDAVYSIAFSEDENFVLDINGASKNNGGNLQLYTSNGTDAQKFRIKPETDGTYTIFSLSSGKAVDVAGAKYRAGTNIQQYTPNGTAAQKWKITKRDDGTYRIATALKDGRFLSAASVKAGNKTNIQLGGTDPEDPASAFTITRIAGVPAAAGTRVNVANGLYVFTSALKSGMVLDIAGGSKKNGGNLQLYASNGTDAQKFTVVRGSDGYYQIRCLNSNLALDISGGSTRSGANVQQYAVNGTKAQKWIFEASGTGYLCVRSALGTVLDVAGAKTKNGTNVWAYQANRTAAQSWVLTKVAELPEGKAVKAGLYVIKSKQNQNYGIDITDGSVEEGANLQLYVLDNTNAQKFQITGVGNGYFEILNLESGKALAHADGNVFQTKPDADLSQYWKITYTADGDGSVEIVSASDPSLALTVMGSSANGTNIGVKKLTHSNAQKFFLQTTKGYYQSTETKLYPDISRWRPVQNWPLVKQSVAFIISKATQGTTKVDPTLYTFVQNCEKYGIPYWLYTYVEDGDELDQAKFLVKTCSPIIGKYFRGYCLDVESENEEASTKLALEYLKKQGYKTIVYTGFQHSGLYTDMLQNRGSTVAWWEARYGKNTGVYDSQYPCHAGADLHQFTSRGKCPGISDSMDLNRLTGTKPESWFTTR